MFVQLECGCVGVIDRYGDFLLLRSEGVTSDFVCQIDDHDLSHLNKIQENKYKALSENESFEIARQITNLIRLGEAALEIQSTQKRIATLAEKVNLG